jgi:quercetin dioxygenase-like cupin family protein
MPLKISKSEMQAGDQKQKQVGQGGAMSVYQIYGTQCGMMVATRAGGYHSSPHKHIAEQLNYVIDGEIWIFVEQEAFHLHAGDFLRVPSMTVHWAWIRSSQPCTMVEAFSPAHWITRSGTVGLLIEGRDAPVEEQSRNIPVPVELAAEVESRHFGGSC